MIYYIIVGGLAGWIGGQIMRGSGFGILGNILVGIIGGVVGGWVFKFLGIKMESSFTGSLITALAGALLTLWAFGYADRGGKRRR
ncbi:MAG: GlsB/YeaQ/YmgE family stress response membrane protein [Saprospiraceae bacterium]